MRKSTLALLLVAVPAAIAQMGSGSGGGSGGGSGDGSGDGSGSGVGSGSGGPPPRGRGSCSGGACSFEPGRAGSKTMGAHVQGKSGKVTLFPAGSAKGMNSANAITVELDSVWEILSDGTKANGGTPSEKHGFENFAQTTFRTSPFLPINMTGPEGPLAAMKFNISADITSVASQARLELLFFSDSGPVANAGEVIRVNNGSTKINIDLEGWTFCDASDSGIPCHDKAGEHVDISFAVGGRSPKGDAHEAPPDRRGPPPPGEPRPKREPQVVGLGGGANMTMSTMVKVDGQWQNMTEGYPQLAMRGGRLHVTIRVPRFSSRIHYDPVLSYDSDPEEDNGDNTGSAPTAGVSLPALLCAAVAAVGAAAARL